MLYNAILGVSPSSKLFKNFREKSSLAYTVRSKYYRFKNYIIIYAGIDKNKYEVSKKVIEKELENMKNDITNEEFESAKECILSDLNQWDDSKIALTKIKLANILSFKNGFETLDTMYENLNNVTLDDVKNIASKVYISKIYLMGGK
jgi:predicted Zn-dependent peptidase